MRLADAIYLWAFASLTGSPGAGPSMTPVAAPVTPTTQHFEHSGTGSSASCTVVLPTAASTTSTPGGPTAPRTISSKPLDKLQPWDI
jgi:hypothetical protein